MLCATRAEACVRPFLAEMGPLAKACGGRFGVVLDGAESAERWKQLGLRAYQFVAEDGVHQAMQQVVSECRTEYILILDDDERCTMRLANWLIGKHYQSAPFWYVPRAWLYQDRHHFISSKKHWPNHALRIGAQEAITVLTGPIHAGWMAGPGAKEICPYAIEHHKLLIRSLAERKDTVAKYEAIKPGAGMPNHYLPECVMVDVAEWTG